MTIMAIIVPGEVIITAFCVTIKLVGPRAAIEAATLSFVTIVSMVVVRECSCSWHCPAQRLTLCTSHDGAELCHQAIAPVTQLIDMELITFTYSCGGWSCSCCFGCSCCSGSGCCFCCCCFSSSGDCWGSCCCSSWVYQKNCLVILITKLQNQIYLNNSLVETEII